MRPTSTHTRPVPSGWAPVTFAALLLSACGGGGSGDPGASTASTATGGTIATTASAGTTTDGTGQASADTVVSRTDAARFLTQATFGPNEAEIASVMALGYSAWIDRQFALPATSHRAHWEAVNAANLAANPTTVTGQDPVWEAFWDQAVNGPDQLRLRVAFALSEIFVISAIDGNVGNQPRAMADWLDMLGDRSFGSYRQLLESVALHPMMGLYLSWLKNQKADATTGRIPDQNFARESMQLFSVGLVQLNRDGSPALFNGQPLEVYGPADVAGLSRVYTGYSWACGAVNAGCFLNGSTGGVADPDRYIKPMVPYPQYHSTEVKSFLGTTIPASTAPDPAGDLKIALDALATHPNTASFISRQLIQRLASSNPSSSYVEAVTKAFLKTGGDLKSVVKAVLLNPEARNGSPDAGGKLKEPVLRLSAYLRAFPHTSDTGNFKVGNTDAVATSLGQTPLRSPSVFNFFRPGYVPPGTATAAAGLVAPEMQLVNETSVSGWVNSMRDNLSSGVGQYNGTVVTTAGTTTFNRRDLQRNWAPEMALAATPAALVDSVTDKLLVGMAGTDLKTQISTAIGKITIPALNTTGSNQASVDSAKRARVNAAVLLTLASPEFLAQK